MRALHFQRVVGAGAFGTVYLCDLVADKGFRRQVAVKVLQRDHPNAQGFMARVRDEARLLGLLQDDHILKVLELVSVDGRDAVVMEFVEGLDLAALVEAGQKPPARALAELGVAVAGALHRAHTAKHPATGEALHVIHRDVKPANVMVTARGGVKLLDFGVARARFEARESFTGQFVLGTLNYMAPEYIVTGEISPAADVYGLGLTLWETIVGEVFGQPRLKPEQHNTRLKANLGRVSGAYAGLIPLLGRTLEFDPKKRPTTDEVERELAQIADSVAGQGLRTWCGTVVPQALGKRAPAKDEAGLLGREIALGGEDSSSNLAKPKELAKVAPFPLRADDEYSRVTPGPLLPPPREPSALPESRLVPPTTLDNPVTPPARAPGPVPRAASPISVAAPAPPAQRPLPSPAPAVMPAPPKPKPKPRGPSTFWLVVQGLIVGGGLGVLVVLGLVALFLLRRFW